MQQQQQQQQSSQRNSFFRANRPGNLNIINDVTSDSTIQQQQLQSYNQQPLSAGYSNSYNNNQANYTSTQQTNLNSPHYIHQSQISPSYSSYPGQYQSSKINYEQSFTPKYSPGPSSAHIVNKQNYFNFDVPTKSSNTQIPQSPGPVQIQNKYNQVPSSPHLTNQAKNLSLSNTFGTQNSRYQANYQPFSNTYQNPPHTPVSAIPYQSYNTIQSQHLNHSLSVPSSPAHNFKPNHHNLQNQHSVFQFNTLNSSLSNNNSSNTTNNAASNSSNFNNPTASSSLNNSNQLPVQNFANFYSHSTSGESNRRVVTSESFEFNPVDVSANFEDHKQSSQQRQTDTNENLSGNTFSENDVDMVQEVINNMMQKEENNKNKLSPERYMLSNETSSSSVHNPNSNNIDASNNNFDDNFEMNFEANSSQKDTSMDMLDLNNNPVSENKNGNKNNLDSLASIANIILNPEQKANESKQFMYSLSNLSEAASAEFVLNYGSDNSKFKSKHIENDAMEKTKMLRKQPKPHAKDMYSNSPQSYEEVYGSSVNDKYKSVDILAPQNNSSIQTCPDCGKIFTNKSALAKHRLIHSNERKYSCHLCDKSFKRQDHLNGHLLTHQDKKPFVCKAPGCDKSYCDSRSLKRHVESQHQDFLAQLAHGNKEALNYLPSIGKIKANVAPNFQHEISVQDLMKSDK